MKDTIVVTDLNIAVVTASEAARQQRDALLAIARKGTIVTSNEGAERAATILKDIKAFTRSIEDGRKQAKAPILDLGKKVDGLAGELIDELEREADRIAKLIGAYRIEQERIAEEARRKAFEEEERIRREAEEKQRQADLEAKRIQDELAAKEARARSEAGKERAAAEAEAARKKADEEAEKLRLETAHKAAQARLAVPTVAKPAGIVTRHEIKFEVTDIVALYEANPAFVILSPNNAALKAALKQLPEGQHLPGVRHWKEAAATVR